MEESKNSVVRPAEALTKRQKRPQGKPNKFGLILRQGNKVLYKEIALEAAGDFFKGNG